MLRFIFILFSIIFIGYILKGIIKVILTFLNGTRNTPQDNVITTEKKPAIQYDKSKVVDAKFEDIK